MYYGQFSAEHQECRGTCPVLDVIVRLRGSVNEEHQKIQCNIDRTGKQDTEKKIVRNSLIQCIGEIEIDAESEFKNKAHDGHYQHEVL